MKWYKRDPSAALAGMVGLDAEERGFYNTLLDLLYARDGDVTDELVIKAMACRPQVWRRVKARLIEKGKVRETGAKLTANRVEKELETAAKLITNMTALRQRQLENQILNSGDTARTTTTTSTSRKKDNRKRPSLPLGDWMPELHSHERKEWEKFKSYHLARDSRFVNWEQAWRGWKQRAIEYGNLKEPTATVLPIKGHHAREGTSEMAAWDAYWMRTRGVRAPRSRRIDGAIFESRWPPGHKARTADHIPTNGASGLEVNAPVELAARASGELFGSASRPAVFDDGGKDQEGRPLRVENG